MTEFKQDILDALLQIAIAHNTSLLTVRLAVEAVMSAPEFKKVEQAELLFFLESESRNVPSFSQEYQNDRQPQSDSPDSRPRRANTPRKRS